MKKAVLAVALMFLPSLAYPQSQVPSAPDVVSVFLGFSDAQRAGFEQLLQTFQSDVANVLQQLKQKQAMLELLLNSGEPDPSTIGNVVLQVRAIQSQMNVLIQSYHDGFISLLTDDQKQKVQAVVQALQLLPAVQAFVGVQLLHPPQ